MNQQQSYLVNLVNQLLDTVHQQQLQADQNNQTTLSQASSAKLDRQRLDQIMQVLTEIKSGLANSDLTLPTVQSYQTQIEQVEGQLRQQIRETDNQITQGLQQAVAALAQVQGAMLDSQTYTNIEQMTADLKTTLDQLLMQ
ncbi:MAG TPA: hypothetical protein GX016_01430 [Firmicutes bacterium]|jgi:hypothetical protein|nr:hypothetical protein [Bacillota bacterium]HHT70224.1 hypothetical protein [Bacillota bacterium]